MKTPRVPAKAWFCLFFVLLIAGLSTIAFQWFDSPETFKQSWIYKNAIYPAGTSVKNMLTSVVFYVALAIILVIERLMPAKRNQKILSIGFAQDVVWFFLDICFQATIILAITTFWKSIYQEYFSFLTIKGIEQLPFWLRLTIGILVADFAGYLHHYLRHKIWWLWPFHAVHHSQKELNMFTDVRYHIGEYAITAVTNVFFLSMFTINPYAIAYYQIFHKWYTKMCHANIKHDFGWIKYILITPQSHRIHHSIEHQHIDKNFGILLSIWDYLFRTQWRKYDEYPDTGIDDHTFPHETDRKWWNLIWMPVKQHVYPFKAIAGIIRNKKARAS